MATPRPEVPKQNSSYSAQQEKKGKSKGKVVIELPYSREYIPNSGPIPGPITFAPPADSTAYIIDRILLPPEGRGSDGKPKPRRPTYIVGWRDMPGARLLVSVMDILDYVSPWEVERWEMELETELSVQRRKMAEEKKREKEALAQPNQLQPRKQTKKGRPPKNAEIETAATAELESEDVGTTRLESSALGFTPQKPLLEEFVGMSDTDGTPSRQLAAEQGEILAFEAEGDDVDVVEYHEAVEDEKALAEQLGTVDMGFGDAENGLGSLPPLELQQTNPDTALTPLANKAKLQQRSQHHPTIASWVTANPSLHKAPALNAPPLDFPTLSDSKLSEVTTRPSSQDDSVQTEAHIKKPKGALASKGPKRRQKPVSTEKPPAPKKRKRASEGQFPVEVEGEQQWIVKRLEDSELYNVEGVGLVRYFKVLWEGDWPPDQNPSWEPEDNLPAVLVRNYNKRSKDRLTKTQKAKKKKKAMTQTTLSWGEGKRCDSVSQAFAGDETDLAAPKEEEAEDEDTNIQGYDKEDDAEDELLVVDNTQRNGTLAKFSWGGQRKGIFGIAG